MKPIQFLATGDLQCGEFQQFNYVRKDGQGSRLHNTLKVFRVLEHHAKKLGIDKILLNGDIFEDASYIDVSVYDAVYRQVERLHRHGMDVVINIGNHDVTRVGRDRTLHCLRPFRKIAQVIEHPTLVWGCLRVVPWIQDPEQFKRTMHILDPAPCLALHQGVQGALTGPNQVLIRNQIQLKDIRPSDFDLILLSDYHTSQQLAKNVFYLGSPMQHSFGEVHKPSISLISIDRHTCSLKPIYTSFPRFRWFNIREVAEARKQFKKFPGDYFRMQLSSSVQPSDIERLATRYHCQVRIVHAPNETASREPVSEVAEMLGAVDSYVRRQVSSRGKRKRLLVLGSQLLSKG